MIRVTIHIDNFEQLFDDAVSIDVELLAEPRKGDRLFLVPMYKKRLEELATIAMKDSTKSGKFKQGPYLEWLASKEHSWKVDFAEADVVCEVGHRTNSVGKGASFHIELTHYDRFKNK